MTVECMLDGFPTWTNEEERQFVLKDYDFENLPRVKTEAAKGTKWERVGRMREGDFGH